MPVCLDTEYLRREADSLPAAFARRCVSSSPESERLFIRSSLRDGKRRLLIQGDQWLLRLMGEIKAINLQGSTCMYIKLDTLLRDAVALLRRHGFDPCVISSMSGLAWTQKHFRSEDWTIRDFEDSALGEAMSTEILPVLAMYQLHCTLADLGVPVLRKYIDSASALMSELTALQWSDVVLLTDGSDDVWLKTDVAVIHYDNIVPGSDFIPIFSSKHIISEFGLTRSQFMEVVILVSCLPLPQFHKRCLALTKAPIDALIEVELIKVDKVVKWAAGNLGTSMITSSNGPVASHIDQVRKSLSAVVIADVKKWIHMCCTDGVNESESIISESKSSLASATDDTLGSTSAATTAASDADAPMATPRTTAATEALKNYGTDLPKFSTLFPKLVKSLRESLTKTSTKMDYVPTIALNYLRRNKNTALASFDMDCLVSLEDGYRLSRKRFSKVARFVLSGNDFESTKDSKISVIAHAGNAMTPGDVLTFNRYQIACEAFCISLGASVTFSMSGSPAYFANALLYRSYLGQIRQTGIASSSSGSLLCGDGVGVGAGPVLSAVHDDSDDAAASDLGGSSEDEDSDTDSDRSVDGSAAPNSFKEDGSALSSSGYARFTSDSSDSVPNKGGLRVGNGELTLESISEESRLTLELSQPAQLYGLLPKIGDIAPPLFASSADSPLLQNSSLPFSRFSGPSSFGGNESAGSLYPSLNTNVNSRFASVLDESSFSFATSEGSSLSAGFGKPPLGSDMGLSGKPPLNPSSGIGSIGTFAPSPEGSSQRRGVPQLQLGSRLFSGSDAGLQSDRSRGSALPPPIPSDERVLSSQLNPNTASFTPMYSRGLVDSSPRRAYELPREPLESKKNVILAHIEKHSVCIIQSAPGCGKSLVIPKIIYEHGIQTNRSFSLMVSEPNVASATQLKTDLGRVIGDSVVGLRIGQGSKVGTDDTKVWYVTSTYLAKCIAQRPHVLSNYTHIVLDGLNERSTDLDLLCLLMKSYFKSYPLLKLILLGSTVNTELFQNYFGLSPDCILRVGSQLHPVTFFYSDDLLSILGPQHEKLINKIHTSYLSRAQELMGGTASQLTTPRHGIPSPRTRSNSALSPRVTLSGTNMNSPRPVLSSSGLNALNASMHFGANQVANIGFTPRSDGSHIETSSISDAIIRDQMDIALNLTVQVTRPSQVAMLFVPGLGDVFEICEKFEIFFQEHRTPNRYRIVRIHSGSDADVEPLFRDFAPDDIKIIVVGDVPESSVNVPSVDHVICLGTSKIMCLNEVYAAYQHTNYYISQAIANERAGKTGRSGPGCVYRIYPRDFFSCLTPHSLPDTMRLPLTDVIMRVLLMLDGSSFIYKSLRELLLELPDAPSVHMIDSACAYLCSKQICYTLADDVKLTAYGRYAARVAKDIRICRLIYDGIMLGVGAEAVVVATAMLMPRSPFKSASSSIYTDPDDYYDIVRVSICAKARIDGGQMSEPIMLLSLLIMWRSCQTLAEKEAMSIQNALSMSRMEDFDRSVQALAASVSAALGVDVRLPEGMRPHVSKRTGNMLRLACVWAFSENICKMEPDMNPPVPNARCALIQDPKDITHSLFQRVLLGPPNIARAPGPPIQWLLCEKGRVCYSAIAIERSFKDTLSSFKGIFMSMRVQVGWLECKHLNPEEVVVIARSDLHEEVYNILNSVFHSAVDSIGVHEGLSLFVVVPPSQAHLRRMSDISFDGFSTISFATAGAGVKQKKGYYHSTLTCSNCQPTVGHIRHIFLRTGTYTNPCSSIHRRECPYDAPCDMHWAVPPYVLDKFSNWFFKTKVINSSTIIMFNEDPSSEYAGADPPRCALISDIPLGLRILNSIRSGSQKNQVLRLHESFRDASNKVSVKLKTAECDWISFRNDFILSAAGVPPLANSNGSPKRIVMPLQSLQQVALHTGNEKLFAVCAYLVILADNTARASGVSFLPVGDRWLNLALACLDPSKAISSLFGVTTDEVQMMLDLRVTMAQGLNPTAAGKIQMLIDNLFREWY